MAGSLNDEQKVEMYWKGGQVRQGIQPHESGAEEQQSRFMDWAVPSLYHALSPSLQAVVRTVLLVHQRNPMWAQLPPDIALEILRFAVLHLLQFRHESDFDTNGLIYYLGTQRNTQEWVNPAKDCRRSPDGNSITGSLLIPIVSAVASGNPKVVCERGGAGGYTTPVPNSFLGVDLGVSTNVLLSPSHYTFSTRSHGGTPRAIRNWEFQGSRDGINWVLIRKHTDDASLEDVRGASHTWEVDSLGHFYRAFRIVQTGPNAYKSTGGHVQDNVAQLNFGCMELYGCAMLTNNE